jgi:uncharacterized membrane protein YfcA
VSTLLILFIAGLVGGVLNSVAGGGSFVVFPALMFTGVSPVIANATTAAGLLPASFMSAVAYRRDFTYDRLFVVLAVASTLGGVLGAAVLLGTKESTFELVLPGLLAFASLVFTFGGSVVARLGKLAQGAGGLLVVFVVQVVIATYGGYFGGGMGILMLATFAFVGLTDIHRMNGMKSALAVVINGAAVLLFALTHKVVPYPWLAVALGGMTGGYLGARVARRLPAAKVRRFVILYAWLMTAYFAWKTYAAK